MKFNCSGESIRREIEYAMGCSAQKSSMSLTSAVLLECDGDRLNVRSSDGKMTYSSSIPVDVMVPGSTAVFCDKLLAILKNMPEGSLEFTESDGKLAIRPIDGSKIKVNLKTMDGTRFPAFEDCGKEDYFTLPQREFCDMADRTMLCVSDDQSRPFLTGVYLDSRGNELRMVATDGRRMGYAWENIEHDIPAFPASILPVKFLQIVRAIASGEGTFSLAVKDGNVYAKVGERTVRSSIIGGSYPNYERVIPKSFAEVCSVNTDDLSKAISLISVMIESKSKRIFLDVGQEGLMVSGENNEYGDSRQAIPCEYGGPDMKMSFNCSLLLPCVKKVGTKNVEVCLNSASAAIGIRPEGVGNQLYVLMPMQV